MVSLISTGSNYIIVIMGVIYAITCFTVFLPSTEKRQVKRMDRQELFMFVFHFICIICQNFGYKDYFFVSCAGRIF